MFLCKEIGIEESAVLAYLSDGFLDGSLVECPLHGAQFDVKTGRAMSPPADGIFAARIAAALASAMCPSRRLIHTGLFGVTESIQELCGSSPPQF